MFYSLGGTLLDNPKLSERSEGSLGVSRQERARQCLEEVHSQWKNAAISKYNAHNEMTHVYYKYRYKYL